MSSVQSLREFIGERLTAAAEEIFSHVERTIFKLEEELERQRRRMDMMMKSHLQLTTSGWRCRAPCRQNARNVLPQSDLRNFSVKQEEPDPPLIKEQQEETCISQDEDQPDLKQEAAILMLTLHEENELREEDLSSQQLQTQSCTDGQDEEAASTAEPQIRSDRSRVRSADVCPKSVRRYSCEVCWKSYTAAHSLKCHMRVHTGERPYSCKECCKSFSQSSHLATHMITHTGAKMFSCRVCGKKFSQSHHLGSHMRTHSGEKPFSCEECGQTFSQKSHLAGHMTTHTGEKLFFCEFCSKGFSRSSHLTSHVMIHTGSRPFSCTECNKSFAQSSNLTRHIKTHSRGGALLDS